MPIVINHDADNLYDGTGITEAEHNALEEKVRTSLLHCVEIMNGTPADAEFSNLKTTHFIEQALQFSPEELVILAGSYLEKVLDEKIAEQKKQAMMAKFMAAMQAGVGLSPEGEAPEPKPEDTVHDAIVITGPEGQA